MPEGDEMKRELIQQVADKLHGFGYEVHISADGRHGFYTDGKRAVSFGGQWNFSVDFSGNYEPSRTSGTGWQIATEQSDISEEQSASYIKANAPSWTGNTNPTYTIKGGDAPHKPSSAAQGKSTPTRADSLRPFWIADGWPDRTTVESRPSRQQSPPPQHSPPKWTA
jgi:hypothetical protein